MRPPASIRSAPSAPCTPETATTRSANPWARPAVPAEPRPSNLPRVVDNAEGSRASRAFTAAHWGLAPQREFPERRLFPLPCPFGRRATFHRFPPWAFQDALSLDVERVRGCCIHVVGSRWQNDSLLPLQSDELRQHFSLPGPCRRRMPGHDYASFSLAAGRLA